MTTSSRFKCVVCWKMYDPLKSRAEYKGLCSMKCQRELAKRCGWRPGDKGAFMWRYINAKLRELRRSTEGADPVQE